jgi:hypothetical protein
MRETIMPLRTRDRDSKYQWVPAGNAGHHHRRKISQAARQWGEVSISKFGPRLHDGRDSGRDHRHANEALRLGGRAADCVYHEQNIDPADRENEKML